MTPYRARCLLDRPASHFHSWPTSHAYVTTHISHNTRHRAHRPQLVVRCAVAERQSHCHKTLEASDIYGTLSLCTHYTTAPNRPITTLLTRPPIHPPSNPPSRRPPLDPHTRDSSAGSGGGGGGERLRLLERLLEGSEARGEAVLGRGEGVRVRGRIRDRVRVRGGLWSGTGSGIGIG